MKVLSFIYHSIQQPILINPFANQLPNPTSLFYQQLLTLVDSISL